MAKFIIFSVVVILSVYFTEQSHFLSKEHIQKINQVAKTWKAKQNFPTNTSIHQIKQLMGVLSLKKRNFQQNLFNLKEYDSSNENQKNIPDTFDARTHWSHCPLIGEVVDQGNCGSCWAVSAATAFSDRFCIASNGTINQQLSAEQLLFCCTECGLGCLGGYPSMAWRYFAYHGIVSGGYENEGCQPYDIPPCVNEKGQNSCVGEPTEIIHECHKKCVGDKRIIYRANNFRAKRNYDVHYKRWPQELLANGPIQVDFIVYDDFLSYASGVYQKTKNAIEVGPHAVKLIGWGTENGVPYWLMINSWGTYWGDEGLFKIRRGTNECSLELIGYAGSPLVV